MPEQAKTNLKVIKVGTYRMFFIFASVASLVFFGASQNLIVLSVALGILFGWIIFELNVLLQAVMGVQRLLMYAIQPKKQPSGPMGKPQKKLIDINSSSDEAKITHE